MSTSYVVAYIVFPPQPILQVPSQTFPGCWPLSKAPRHTISAPRVPAAVLTTTPLPGAGTHLPATSASDGLNITDTKIEVNAKVFLILPASPGSRVSCLNGLHSPRGGPLIVILYAEALHATRLSHKH